MLDWLILIVMALSTPCTAEDGPAPCYWDAQTQGNRLGTSVLILEDR
jgi:hypothetical protein